MTLPWSHLVFAGDLSNLLLFFMIKNFNLHLILDEAPFNQKDLHRRLVVGPVGVRQKVLSSCVPAEIISVTCMTCIVPGHKPIICNDAAWDECTVVLGIVCIGCSSS